MLHATYPTDEYACDAASGEREESCARTEVFCPLAVDFSIFCLFLGCLLESWWGCHRTLLTMANDFFFHFCTRVTRDESEMVSGIIFMVNIKVRVDVLYHRSS